MNETETMTATRPPMPPKVAAAISAVMKAVPKLGKDETNKHGGYNFASIDVFLEVVGRLCADAGLIISQDEESFEVVTPVDKDGKPTSPWLKIVYSFTLAHSSGETWEHRPKRSIMVMASMGAQAFGAAQSYALKNYERSLFQIATGDGEDADAHPQTNLPAARGGSRQQTPASKPQSHPDDLGATDYKAGLRAFEVERVGILQALRGGEMTAQDANDRYREIRAGTLLIKPNGKEKTIKVEALLKQCMRSAEWHDNDRDGWQGFERRLKDTRDELDRALAKAGDAMPSDPFSEPQEAAE